MRVTPILKGVPEATRSLYTYCIISHTVDLLFPDAFRLLPEYYLEGLNGRGPVDYVIEQAKTRSLVGVTEVKREDFEKGVAQNMVQLETIVEDQKRKAEDMSDAPIVSDPIKRFGIVTDAQSWYFLECYQVGNTPQFRMSKEYNIAYRQDKLGQGVKVIMEIIGWFLVGAKDIADSAGQDSCKKQKLDGGTADLVE